MEYIYSTNANGATLTGVTIEEGEEITQLIIPDFYMGLPVLAVVAANTDLYTGLENITDIVIGNNVRTIYGNYLREIFLGANIQHIYLGKAVQSSNGNYTLRHSSTFGANVTDIYYHPDCPLNIATENSAGLPINHHKGTLNIKYKLVGDYINNTSLNLDGYALEEFVEDYVDEKFEDFAITGEQVQADYLETDDTKASFIKNKPAVDSEVKEDSDSLITSGAVFKAIQNIELPESGGTGTIPTKLSELDDDETHRLVTDAEKEVWNNKSDFSGNYSDLNGLPEIPSVEGLATEVLVKESIDEALSFEEIDLPEDFESYTDAIHISEPISKDWSKVKIWSANDGLAVSEEKNPYKFNFSQISETNYATIGAIPSKIDLSLLDGKSVAASIIFEISVGESSGVFGIQLIKTDSLFQLAIFSHSSLNLQYLQEGGTISAIDNFVASTEGWYIPNFSDGTVAEATAEDLSVLSGTYKAVKILDWTSFFPDDTTEMGVSDTSPEILLNLFLKDMISVSYAPGYYVTDKSEKYATKKEISSLLETFATMLDAANREVI